MLLYLIRPSKVVLHLIYVSLEGFIFLQTWNENNIPARWELFLLYLQRAIKKIFDHVVITQGNIFP